MTAEETLKEIADEVVVCTRCKLHQTRKNAVPGKGNPNTKVLFIGEGLGFHENEKGVPFVGAAGGFLDELLSEAGLSREEVFITNVVKCRPPGNRDPEPDELEACKYFLERQISAINPDIIVTLGRVSMGYFINNGKISQIHGRDFWAHDRMVVPMYHPAAALHQPALRNVVKEDFRRLPALVEKAQKDSRSIHAVGKSDATKQEDPPEDQGPEQLRLF